MRSILEVSLGLDFNHHRLAIPVYCKILLRVAKTQVTPAGERNTAAGTSEDPNSAHPTSAHKDAVIPDPICSPKGEVIPPPETFTMRKPPQFPSWPLPSLLHLCYALHDLLGTGMGPSFFNTPSKYTCLIIILWAFRGVLPIFIFV